jgi:hypothetical protein
MEFVRNVYYYFGLLTDNDMENETEDFQVSMDMIKDLILNETDSLRIINIDDTFQSQLVLFNNNDEYTLMYKQDYDNDDYTQVITGNKHFIFHWITSFLNSNYSLDEIEILGE